MSEARLVRPRVTAIPATLNRFTAMPIYGAKRRRVAAYARVSTNSEEQKTSYDAQVSYYTEYIKAKDDWEFVHVYTDKGITGTSTKKREGFNQMVQDALAGKIDLIITKSVSRFARNTVDSLTTIRLLKEHGIEVYFEEQNIYTLDSKGELFLTIMSSIAQEESRSISENVTWGQRKRFADGKVTMPYKQFLGYRRGEDGQPEIVPEEAETVRRIYRLFLEGQTPYGIKKILEADGIPSPAGKKTWQAGTILSILTNEKYKGDALLQKTFCTDFLTKKMKINEGEVPQYYVENSHPAIVSAEMFEMVQEELARRKQMGRQHNGTSCFAGTIFCECCGGMYGSKVWHPNTKYRRVVWQCNGKYKKGDPVCATPNLTETVIQEKFLEAFNRLLSQREFIQQDIKTIIAFLTYTKALRAEAAELHNEMDIVTALMKQAIQQNASMALNQEEYAQRYRALAERYQKAELRFKAIEDECAKRTSKRRSLTAFASRLMESDEKITEFTPTLWNAMVEKVLVAANGTLRFIFRNGTEISV